MLDLHSRAFRRTQALITASRSLCALTELTVRHSRAAIGRTARVLAEPPPTTFLAPALRRTRP